MTPVIAAHNLTKVFRTGFWKTHSLRALDQLTLEVWENEVFGCLGPNGAGKSTTLKILMGLVYPTSGELEILGRTPYDLRTRKVIGYLPEHPYFYEYLTAEEFLKYYAGLFELPPSLIKDRVGYYLHLAGVYEYRKLQLRKFSKGMIQRVGIVQALLNDPKVVFLDEPMSGLDPIGRREVRDLILRLKEQGKTVFFSTHILNDVEQLCDRVAVLNRGKLAGTGLLKEIISQEIQHIEVVASGIGEDALRAISQTGIAIHSTGTTLRLDLRADSRLGPIIAQIEELGGHILSVNPVRQTMEEYFFSVLEESKVDSPVSQSPA
jgi:ABC-2 type transport system ATP-binding protein